MITRLTTLLFVLPLAAARGQTLVRDINATHVANPSSFPAEFANIQRAVTVFRAQTMATGSELFRIHTTTGATQLVKDIAPGAASSSPAGFERVANRLDTRWVFAANDGVHGRELWTTDGTTSGTYMLRDIAPGLASSSPTVLARHDAGRFLFFAATNAQYGRELWRTDGTKAGTRLVADIRPGSASSSPANAVYGSTNQRIFFAADDGTHGRELWMSTGEASNTALVRDIRPGSGSSSPSRLTMSGGSLLWFTADDGTTGLELWYAQHKRDEIYSAAILADIRPRAAGSNPTNLSVHSSLAYYLYFSADDGRSGRELWVADFRTRTAQIVTLNNRGELHPNGSSNPGPVFNYGTHSNPGLVVATSEKFGREVFNVIGTKAILAADINPGPASSYPSNLTRAPVGFVMTATSASTGRELWDWRSGGVSLLADVVPGKMSSTPGSFVTLGSSVYFTADTAVGRELWRCEQRARKTSLVRDIRAGTASSNIASMHVANSRNGFEMLVLSANDGTHGTELVRTNGTSKGTVVVDIHALQGHTESSSPRGVTDSFGRTFFAADDGQRGAELWITDGTTGGTRLVKDLLPGATGSMPAEFTRIGKRVLFTAQSPKRGRELWISDGTAQGTGVLKDIRIGAGTSNPSDLVCVAGRVFFRANDGIHGTELWITDGSLPGTQMVKDIAIGAKSALASSSPIVELNDAAYFFASTAAHGRELWKSDGSANGTVLVEDIRPGIGSAVAETSLVAFQGRVWFGATTAGSGTELWSSNGTTTMLVKDIVPGVAGSFPAQLTVAGSRMFFRATTPATGYELWVTNGTSTGTMLVRDIRPGAASASPHEISAMRGARVVFTADSPSAGREPWISNGTAAGTYLLRDVRPGTSTSSPSGYVQAGLRYAYFSANDGSSGVELWRTNGTPNGTIRVSDLAPGEASSSPHSFVLSHGKLLFAADDGVTGVELRSLFPGANGKRIGRACGTTTRKATLDVADLVLGTSAAAQIDRAEPFSVGILMFGAPDPAPLSLGYGCTNYITLPSLLVWEVKAVPSFGQWMSTISTPYDLDLIGMRIAWQAWHLPTAAPGGFELTNGYETAIGN